MPKVFLTTRKKLFQVEYIIPYKKLLAGRSKPTLPPRRQPKRLSKSRHGRARLTLSRLSALVIDSTSRHSVSHSNAPSSKASVLIERTLHGDTNLNPHRWSPTVRRKRKPSPVPISFHLSSHKTVLKIETQPNTLQPFPSGQNKASPKPSCNEVIRRQQQQLKSDSAALREWIACIIFGFALRDNQRDQTLSAARFKAVAAVAANIKYLFDTYPLHSDEMAFLALWYASHMIPQGLLDQFHLYQPDGIVLATRLFVLGYTLAIKWLADESFLLQTWVPHYQKGFSISSAKTLDKAALELLDYNIYVSPFQWTAWLHKLDEPPSANTFLEDRVHLVAQARIRKLLLKVEKSSPSSWSRSLPISITAVWKVHNILLEDLAVSVPFPEPAPWNPAGDPIIHITGRRQSFTQVPPSWSCGNRCYSSQPNVTPLVAYNSKEEVRAELLVGPACYI